MESILLNGIRYDSENLDKIFCSGEFPDSFREAIYEFLQNWYDDTDFILANTSGSTGTPKSIHLSKQSMVNSARMTNRYFGLTPESVGLLCLPATYIAGKMMLVRAMEGKFNLLAVEPSANPFKTLHTAIDFAAITPYQLFHSAESLQQFPVRKIIVGGGPVTTKLEKLAENIPAELYETYGMTETCSHIALRRFNGEEKSDYFTILDGVAIRLDERGCLAIRAPHLLPDEIQTNDIVELKGDTSFRWLGRADSTINSGGIKIHPELVERKLEGIIPTPFFIASLSDEVLENKVVLVIESEAYSTEQEEDLKARLENVLSKYEMPKQLFYVPNFSYSESNKVLRKESLEKAINQIFTD
ncbi:MAG: AMP-binding protein [Paludibacter sp.]|nr:AMP-binding protein [Paludibacter sp.]